MSEIKVNIKDRVEWLSKRISLEEYQKDYITFQMKEAVREALQQVKNNDLLHSVSEPFSMQEMIDFASGISGKKLTEGDVELFKNAR